MSRQWRSAFFLVRNTLAKNICPTYHAGQIHSADLKEERCVAAIKTRGRQYNTNILYFTANCGWRGNNRGSQEGLMLKRSPHTGRKQNMIIGASFYHSGQLDIWNSGQIKLILCLCICMGRKLEHIQCCCSSTCFTDFVCTNCIVARCSCNWSWVTICLHCWTWLCFSRGVDRLRRPHNHGCRCSGCNLEKKRCIRVQKSFFSNL